MFLKCMVKQIVAEPQQIYGLVQERRNPIAIALELPLSSTNPSQYTKKHEPCA